MVMGLFTGIFLVILGLLSLPSLVASKSPKAKELLDKVVPFQGWIGIAGALYGIFGIFSAIQWLGWYFSNGRVVMLITDVGSAVFSLLLGFIFGYGLISQYLLAKASDDVKAKAEEARAKLVGMQTTLGMIGVVLGIWVILYNTILFNIIPI